MQQVQNILILGSTGSIGQSTLSVISHNPHLYRAYALVGRKNVQQMLKQCLEFKPEFVAMACEKSASELKHQLSQHNLNIPVLAGEAEICQLAQHSEIHQVMASIVGSAGLMPTLSAIQAGKRILLANKESLVTCGKLFIEAVRKYNAQLLPVDSEHNAIFQCLPALAQNQIGYCDLKDSGIHKIILTGSGGAFLNKPLNEFDAITPEQACAHPNWSMGQKITVDSATMMNKGLEYIEARWLFNAEASNMEIIIHPQSIIHSMVRYIDGSVIAQMSKPDMRTPIAEAMGYPNRTVAGVSELDFFKLNNLTFIEPDFQRYPCLKLAIEACEAGQYATTIMNAINEINVEAFLKGQIKFPQIAEFNQRLVESFQPQEINCVEDVLALDQQARQQAKNLLDRL